MSLGDFEGMGVGAGGLGELVGVGGGEGKWMQVFYDLAAPQTKQIIARHRGAGTFT